MKALVTGGGGFLGRYIVERLAVRGDFVRVLGRSKYPELSFIIGDFAQASIKCASRSRVIIFNAFPHFPDEAEVFAQAFRILIPGGTLTIAHSMNREALDEHHRHAGIAVQDHVLIADDAFHRLYGEAGFTNVTVENSTLFYSSGRKPSV